jgi:hypothetical protein
MEVKVFLRYPAVKYHWIRDPVVVNSPEEEAALGVARTDSPSVFEPYQGPRPTRTAQQDPTQWVDDWPVLGLTPEHRQAIKIELLRADADFWKSADTPSAHLAAMCQAFDGIAMVVGVAGLLTESLLKKEIPVLVWDSAIAAGWWRRASVTDHRIFPERLGHYWVWRDDGTDWQRQFEVETEIWMGRLATVAAKRAVASDLAPQLDAACESAMISHRDQAARIGIGKSTYFEVKAGRGGKKARRLADEYLRNLRVLQKSD